jgi:uncharacterized membrane protein YbhN (UPF0104 family)
MKVDLASSGHLALWLRVIVTLSVFAAIFYVLPVGAVWHAMSQVGWWRWMAVLCIFGAGHLLAAYKWGRLVRAVSDPLAFGDALRAHLAGLFANIWLPSIVGGDVVRAAWISRRHGVAVPAVIGIIDRVLDFLALLLLVLIGLLFIGDAVDGFVASVLRAVALVMLAGMLAGYVVLRYLKPSQLPLRMRGLGRRIVEIGRALRARPGPALGSLVLSVLIQFVFVGLNHYLGTLIGIEVSFAAWLIAWPLAKIVALLPVSLGGLGVREAALAALLATFSVSGVLAVAEALVWQSILFGFGLVGGLVALWGRYQATD